MEYEKKCDFLLSLINKTDNFWNFFYLSTAAVFITFLHDFSCGIITKICITLIYVLFNIFVACALLRSYKFLNAMVLEIQHEIDEQFSTPMIKQCLRYLKYKQRSTIVILSFSAATAINISILWLN